MVGQNIFQFIHRASNFFTGRYIHIKNFAGSGNGTDRVYFFLYSRFGLLQTGGVPFRDFCKKNSRSGKKMEVSARKIVIRMQ